MDHPKHNNYSRSKKKREQMDDAEAFKNRMFRAQKRKKWLLKYGYRALVTIALGMIALIACIIIFDL